MSSTLVPPAIPRALEHLETLCDPGSLHVIRSEILSKRLSGRAQRGDGVLVASGRVDYRPVFCYAQDATFLGGSLGEAHADAMLRVLELAGDAGVPVVGFVESAGARMQEGVAALAAYARIFRKQVALAGRIPQISIVTGAAAGGGSYSPALADFVIMERSASMFLTGPAVVRDVLREDVSAEQLGGAKVHARNGVAHLTGATVEECVTHARRLLRHLPSNTAQLPEHRPYGVAGDADPSRHVPADGKRVYDVRDVIRDLADDGEVLELMPRWAPNMVTALAHLDGRSVAVVANQPAKLGGVIDADASQKSARFIGQADRFGLPLVVLVDTPGFLPGTRQEGAGVIRHGAELLRAFAGARVPRITVVLRKAYGGAYITMNSRDLGAHMTFAWPSAEIGVMGSRQAVRVIHRRDLEADDDPDGLHARLAEAYAEEHLAIDVAAREGFIDEVIEPAETRLRLAGALGVLATRRRRATDRHPDDQTTRAGSMP